jgi:hypothetical protein
VRTEDFSKKSEGIVQYFTNSTGSTTYFNLHFFLVRIHSTYSLCLKKNDVLDLKFVPKRMTFYLIWHVYM